MNQIYATILRSLLGNDVIESTLLEVEKEYPVLFDRLAELAHPDGSNQEEMVDYSLHVVDAFLKLKQSEIYQNPSMLKVFKAFKAVSNSYKLTGQKEYILPLDVATNIVVMALMSGLKDLNNIAAYSNYANQYLQILFPNMLHPRYRISPQNCRSVMRLIDYDLLDRFYNNFFMRAKVAVRLKTAQDLRDIQPNFIKPKTSLLEMNRQLETFSESDLATIVPCLGLDHGLILGYRDILYLCIDKLILNGYDYLLSLNNISLEHHNELVNRLASTSNAKIMIDDLRKYWNLFDFVSDHMQTIVCVKRLDPATGTVEPFFFISSLPQTEESLYIIQNAIVECEMSLKQESSYIVTLSTDENEALDSFLPQRDQYNRFIVKIMTYERDLSAKLVGNANVKTWDAILYRNGNNPIFAMVSLFYYYMADVLNQDKIIMHQRRRMFDLLGSNPSGAIPRSLLK